jgi:putative transposase
MITVLSAMLAYVRAFLIARHRLAIEAAALRQQLAVYKRKQPRPKLNRFDRLFWVVVRRIWTNWSEALILVKPDTVVSWHRAGYACSGHGDPAGSDWGVRRWRKKSET